MTDEPTSTLTIYSAETARKCSGCTLCCKLVPVRELQKRAGERCQHQRHGKGCTIYDRKPFSCAHYSCRWLLGVDTADLPRPDRCGYVLDPMPDFVRIADDTGRVVANVQTVQIWVDPKRPDAHRDPALRRYLLRRAAEGVIGMVRYGSSGGFAIIPPTMADDGQWHEKTGTAEAEHNFEDYQRAMAEEQQRRKERA